MSESIRVIARALMPKWLNAGLSAARVTQELITMFGRAYRRTELLKDYRTLKDVITNEVPIRRLRGTTQVPKSVMSETTLRLPRRYRIIATAQFKNAATGEMVTRHISWYTNQGRTKDEFISEYIDRLAPAAYDESGIPQSIEIRAIQHHEGMDY